MVMVGGVERSHAWLAKFTGYTAAWAVEVLNSRGIDWKRAPVSQIKAAILDQSNRVHKHRLSRTTKLTYKRKRITAAEFGAIVGVEGYVIIRRYHRLGSWAKVVRESLARPGAWDHLKGRRKCGGRPPSVVTVNGHSKLRSEWLALLDLTKQGIHKAAKKNGRTTSEELEVRIKRWLSDTAGATALEVSFDQPPHMVCGDRTVGAPAASESRKDNAA